MSAINLFFQTRAVIGRAAGAGFGGLEIDASILETHEANCTMTQSEVEDGSAINDNVILLPIKLTLQCIVTLSPLGIAGLVGSAGTAVAGLAGSKIKNSLTKSLVTTGVASLGGLVASAVGGSSGAKSREPGDVWDFLIGLRNARLPFDTVTKLKLYQNMVITGLTTPRNKDNTNALEFTVVLEQVKIVKASNVSLSQIPGAAAIQNLGKQAGSSPSAKTFDAGSSILSNLTGIGK